MKLFPAIDRYEGKAVRLTRGDYAKMTVYSDDPPQLAEAQKKEKLRTQHIQWTI